MDNNLIIKRLKEFYKLHSDKDFCDFFGISTSTMGNWKARKTIDLGRIIPKCADIDYNWLFKGEVTGAKNAPVGNEREMCEFYKREYERKCAELDAANARCDRLIDKLGCSVQQSNKSGDNNFNNQ